MTQIRTILDYRWAALLAAVVRGVVVPDFRYDGFSIVLIQVVWPLLLAFPAIFRTSVPNSRRISLIGLLTFGTIAIVLSEIVGVLIFTFGSDQHVFGRMDPLSRPIFLASFFLQLATFYGLVGVLVALRRALYCGS